MIRDHLQGSSLAIYLQIIALLRRARDYLFPYEDASDSGRRGEMDGIRGWAALSVLICHVRYTSLLEYPGHSFFFNFFAKAVLSVDVFFVLSGDALSLGTTKKGGKGLSPGVILKRIPRLSGTIMLGMTLMYVLHKMGTLCKSREAVESIDLFYNFACPSVDLDNYNFFHYMKFAWMDVFSSADNPIFDSFMWTIKNELKGSILVFAICALLPHIKYRVWIVGASALYSALNFGVALSCFVFGILLGELRALGIFEKLHATNKARIAMGVAVLLIPAIPIHWGPGSTALLALYDPTGIVDFLWRNAALFVVFVLYGSKDAVAFMNNPVSKFLGHISFTLYVVHHHIMSSVLAFLLEKTQNPASYPSEFHKNWISAVTIAVAIGVAYLVYLGEKQYLRLLDHGAKSFLISAKLQPTEITCLDSCSPQSISERNDSTSTDIPASDATYLEEEMDLEVAMNLQYEKVSTY